MEANLFKSFNALKEIQVSHMLPPADYDVNVVSRLLLLLLPPSTIINCNEKKLFWFAHSVSFLLALLACFSHFDMKLATCLIIDAILIKFLVLCSSKFFC